MDVKLSTFRLLDYLKTGEEVSAFWAELGDVSGAWPEYFNFPVGWYERDSKGV